MNHSFFRIFVAILLTGSIFIGGVNCDVTENHPETKTLQEKRSLDETKVETDIPEKKVYTLDDKLDDVQKRLYSIEDKIDHLLFHHNHDVTPHTVEYTPLGPVMVPQITDPHSAHTQMKTHDIIRNGMVNPYGYPNMGMGMGMGMAGGMPGMYGGYPPLY